MPGAYDTMGNQEFGSLPQSFLLLLIAKLHRHINLVEGTRTDMAIQLAQKVTYRADAQVVMRLFD